MLYLPNLIENVLEGREHTLHVCIVYTTHLSTMPNAYHIFNFDLLLYEFKKHFSVGKVGDRAAVASHF